MNRDEIVQIAWDVGLFVRSHHLQDEPTKLEQFAERIAAAEKQKVVEYMNSRAFATGHGDTVEDLLKKWSGRSQSESKRRVQKLRH